MALKNDDDHRDSDTPAQPFAGAVNTVKKPVSWSRLQVLATVAGAAMIVAILCLAAYSIWDGRAVTLPALAVILAIMGLTGFLVREVGRREALTSSLRESELRYRYLFEANPHPMWIYDTETLRFLAVNDAAARHYGYSRDEFFAMTIRDIRPPEDTKRIEQFVSTLDPKLNESGVWRHRKKDGTVFDVEIVSHGFSFGGRPARLVQAQDISARIRAERQLRASEERYRHLFEGNPIAIWVMDEESLQFLAVNQAAIDKYGYTREEFLSLTVADMQDAKERDRVIQQIRSRDAGAVAHYFRRHVTKGGQIIEAEVTVHPFIFDGHQARMILINDVTEKRSAQQALEESEQRYRDLFELNPSPMWVYDIETFAILAVNEVAVMSYGYTRDEFAALTIPEIHPPEDVPEMLRRVRQRDPNAMNVRQVRHCRKDGSILDVEVKSGPIFFGGRVARLVLANDITGRKRAEAARANLAAIVENSNDAIISRTLEGTITSWNSGAERMFGYSAGEAVGRPVTFLLPEGLQSNLEINNQRMLIGKRGMPHESRRVTRDGRVIDVMVSHSPVADSSGKIVGTSVIFHDISALKQAEAALLRERTLLRTVIDNLPDRIYVKDSERRYLLVNQSDLKHRRLATDEAMLGKTTRDFLPRKYADAFDAEDRAVLESGEPLINREFVMESNDGQKAWMMANKIPLRDAAGKIFGLVGIHRDITEVRRSAEAVIQLNAELEQRVIERTAQLEDANKELESFAYSVSHDLRAPLRSIAGFSKALIDDYRGKLDSTALDYLRRVHAASQRMSALIDDLLLLSRITRSEIRRNPTDLSVIAEDIVLELRKGQPQREAGISVATGIRVSADAGLMRVALDNLLGNAWKFTGNQPKAVISVGVESRDGQQVYFIRDNGAGFDMKYADKLFGAFHRLHREADFAGTGVGLAIVQRIIHRHGGKIWAEAAVGKGATFFFTLG